MARRNAERLDEELGLKIPAGRQSTRAYRAERDPARRYELALDLERAVRGGIERVLYGINPSDI